MGTRFDGRKHDELRPVRLHSNFLAAPPGSCLIEMGKTRVLCSAMIEPTVPPFLKNSGKGWLTAEYAMLPASSPQRVQRERAKVGGRTHEIQRLIGRSLRAVFDLGKLGERSILVDCDVLDADGGTRTAAVTGSYVAVALALRKVGLKEPSLAQVMRGSVAAISVGLVGGVPCLDLPYEEDRQAEVDMNVVQTGEGQFVEVQGTAEGRAFTRPELDQLLGLANKGITQLLALQQEALR